MLSIFLRIISKNLNSYAIIKKVAGQTYDVFSFQPMSGLLLGVHGNYTFDQSRQSCDTIPGSVLNLSSDGGL